MDAEIEALLARRFSPRAPGADKRASLREAVERHVRPGDALHLGLTHTRGCAAVWEILRRFRGSAPRFTILGVTVTTPVAPLVHAGLADRIVTSWAGDSYYTPGPSAVYQRAFDAGVAFDHWSILTFSQRLWAGARGLEWTTTRSLAGSSLAENNSDYRPLDGGLGLIRSLTPDVSIFHAPAADAAGNVLMTPPLMENVSGALAARRGAIVTVDRVVPTEVVREASAFTRIPADRVLAVVEAPFGGHPGGVWPRGISGAVGYGEDYPFWAELRRASKDPADLDAWIDEWVIAPGDHEGFLAKLGDERLAALREQTAPDAWRAELEAALDGADLDTPAVPAEVAIVAGARMLAGRAKANGYRTMLAGAGMANLAAWLAAADLADAGAGVDLVAEMGLVGYVPSPGEPFLFNQRNFGSCTMLTDIDHALGVVVGGPHAASIGSLGAAQVDVRGNTNATMAGGRLLMGSGGANDVATCATETIVVAHQIRERMLPQVEYVTGPGDRVSALVTTAGVYEKDEAGELVLTAVHDADVERGVRAARETCGWELRVARSVAATEPPDGESLRTLRLMDPRGYFRR